MTGCREYGGETINLQTRQFKSIMSIFLPKNAQHKLEQQKQAELRAYQNQISDMSDKLIDWLIERDMSVADFNNLVKITEERFRLYFGGKKIKELKNGQKD